MKKEPGFGWRDLGWHCMGGPFLLLCMNELRKPSGRRSMAMTGLGCRMALVGTAVLG